MAIDKSYGSGKSVSATTSASRRAKAGSAALRKQNQKKFNRGTQIGGGKATMVSGSSDYVQRENAARTQLGVSGLAARKRQFPRAARATARGLVREVTGVDVSRKGVNVNPVAVAAALPFGKALKLGRLLPAGTRIAKAAARVSSRSKAAAEAMDKRYLEKFSESLDKKYAAKDMLKPKYVGSESYRDVAFTDWSGGVDRAGNARQYYNRLPEDLANRADVVRGSTSGGGDYISTQYYQLPSSQTRNAAFTTDIESSIAARMAKGAAQEANRIRGLGRGSEAAAAAEIRRRLAALRRANKNR